MLDGTSPARIAPRHFSAKDFLAGVLAERLVRLVPADETSEGDRGLVSMFPLFLTNGNYRIKP